MTEEEHGAEDWLGEEIEDTVKDCLGIWGNDVGPFAESPCNWVEEPEEDSECTAVKICRLGSGAEAPSVLATDDDNVVGDEEQGGSSEYPISPLVARRDESAHKTCDDHNLVDQDGVQNGWQGKTSSQHQIREEKWCGHKPIDVSYVEDLTSHSGNDWVGADELYIDDSVTQV